VAGVSLITLPVLLVLAELPPTALAWNIPGHMLSGAIAYQVLPQENPLANRQVKSGAGETSLVHEPMAGEASRRSRP